MINTQLYEHQKICRDFVLKNNGSGALFLDLGVGKTLTTLSIFAELRKSAPELKMVVICPLSIIENAWINDIAKHTSFLSCNLREELDHNKDIFIINYESAISQRYMAWIKGFFGNMIVLDESVRIKSNTAKTTKKLLEIAPEFKYRIVLSGCPAPNSLVEYWSQMQFVNPTIFHRSFYVFRNQYFHLQRGNQIIQAGMFITRDKYKEIFGKGFRYAITDGNKEKLMIQMKPYAIWVKKDDCMTLPPEIDVIRSIELSKEELKSYKEMKDYLVTVINQEMIAATNALSKLTKLREITSGFLITYEGVVKGFGTSKLNELEAVLEELGSQQAIIWINFKFEAKAILEKLGIEKCAQCHGEVKDKNSEIADFTSGRKQYLIANPASASSGLNLQNASVQIFYSLSYSYDDYYQCRGRTRRPGQTKNCVYIHILAKNTIDMIILDVVRKKGNEVDIVTNFLKI